MAILHVTAFINAFQAKVFWAAADKDRVGSDKP
jgi:hypothetical protein